MLRCQAEKDKSRSRLLLTLDAHTAPQMFEMYYCTSNDRSGWIATERERMSLLRKGRKIPRPRTEAQHWKMNQAKKEDEGEKREERMVTRRQEKE